MLKIKGKGEENHEETNVQYINKFADTSANFKIKILNFADASAKFRKQLKNQYFYKKHIKKRGNLWKKIKC